VKELLIVHKPGIPHRSQKKYDKGPIVHHNTEQYRVEPTYNIHAHIPLENAPRKGITHLKY
jgi:hypothetical protein